MNGANMKMVGLKLEELNAVILKSLTYSRRIIHRKCAVFAVKELNFQLWSNRLMMRLFLESQRELGFSRICSDETSTNSWLFGLWFSFRGHCSPPGVSLCLTEHHDTKVRGGSGIAPHIVRLGSRWK